MPYLADELERYSVPLGDDIVQLLKEYRTLCDQYTSLYHTLTDEGLDTVQLLEAHPSSPSSLSLLHHLEPLHPPPNDTLFIHTHCKLQSVTKNLIRLLNQTPVMETVVNEFRSTRSSKLNHVLKSVSQFNEVINEKLLTTSIDERRQTEHISMTRKRKAETGVIIQQLEQELADAEAKRDHEV